ncbi:hypothetical protein JCM33374_g5165 [Metschnikowia sp. JCM 33374]|nr:hypothetical protein JCM33374_g5165 [Metschnikowia sp. JCM 33374]
MKTLQESQTANHPVKDMSIKTTPGSAAKDASISSARKPKTPLRKEELEKIAQELKKKLSKASVAAKQSLTSSTSASTARNLPPDSPVSQTSLPKSSPLKNYYMWRRQIAGAGAGNKNLTSSPSLYSPNHKSPTSTKPSIFLSSSPLKNFAAQGSPSTARSRKSSMDSNAFTDPNDSPIKRRRADSGAVIRQREPQMVLEEISGPSTPPKTNSLHPSPVLSSSSQNDRQTGSEKTQTTPTLAKKQLNTSNNPLLKTPTQSGRGDAYNDEEGADLLMYLATSPSVSKPYMGNTPRAPSAISTNHNVAFSSNPGASRSLVAGNSFIAPPPPLTPKRPMISSAKTPQNRLTPSFFGGLAVPGSALPSAGLALTPAGFNMNDYVNFFTPSPGQAAAGHNNMMGRTLLKTPDFHGQIQNSTHTPVDGKMINFDKAELFGSSGPEQAKD